MGLATEHSGHSLNQASPPCCTPCQQVRNGVEAMIKVRWLALSAVLALVACGEQEQAQTAPEPEATTTQQMRAPATTAAPEQAAPNASGGYMEVGPGAGKGQGAGGSPASE